MSAQYKKYCRFCAVQKTDEELLDVSIYTHVNDEIKQKLTLFNVAISINLSSNDILPKTICFSCHTSLDNAHEFLLQLQRSQTILKQIFIANLSKSEVSAGLAVKVKAENPFKDEPESEISCSDSDTEFGSYTDQYVPETSVPADGESEESGSEDEIITYMGIPIFEQDLALKDIKKRSKFDKSWTSYKLCCQFCDQSFADMNLVREHSKKAHDLCCAFKCADCGEKFGNFEMFVEHARGHRESLKNYCPYCNVKLQPATATKHITDHKIKESICQRCGKVFDHKYYLADHNTKYKPLKRKLDCIINPNKRKKKRYRNPYMLPLGKVEKIEDKSWSGYPWTCQICESEFGDVFMLRAHIREVHGQCFAMKCVDCKEKVDCYRGFAYHVRRHRPFLRQYCHYCNYKFKENERDTEHISQHFVQSDRVCEGCGEIFPDLNTYQHHLTTYDPPKPKKQPFRREKPVGIEDVTCDICNAVLKSQRCLRAHKLTHTERNKDFTCERCGKAFYKKNALQAHYVTHLETAQEVCNICNKTFKSVTLLKKHLLRHTDDKPFKCEICQKCFRQKNNLTEHLRVHTDETPFKCTYCDKTFRYKSNARTHEYQHTGARPYQCSSCEMVFTNAANRNKHMKRKHGNAPESNRIRGKFPPNVKVEDLDGVDVKGSSNISVC